MELVFLWDIFTQNGHTDRQIRRALDPPSRVAQPDKRPDSIAFLLYVGSIFSSISKDLTRHNIQSVGLSFRKISSVRKSVKAYLALKMPGDYRITCECGQVYIGQVE
jgi:hypothetical protein